MFVSQQNVCKRTYSYIYIYIHASYVYLSDQQPIWMNVYSRATLGGGLGWDGLGGGGTVKTTGQVLSAKVGNVKFPSPTQPLLVRRRKRYPFAS